MYNLNLECTFIQVDWQHNGHNTGLKIYFVICSNKPVFFVLSVFFMQFKEWAFFYWLDFIFLFWGLFEGPQSLDVSLSSCVCWRIFTWVEDCKLIPFWGGLSNTHQLFKSWKLSCMCFNFYEWLATSDCTSDY